MKFEINDDDVFDFAYANCNKSFVDSLIDEVSIIDYSKSKIDDEVCSYISQFGNFDLSYGGLSLQDKATFMIITSIFNRIKYDIINDFDIDENEFTCDYGYKTDDLYSNENYIDNIENAKIYISTRLKDYIVSVNSELAEKYLSLSFVEIN